MILTRVKKVLDRVWAPSGGLILLVVGWEVAVLVGDINRLILPRPLDVVKAAADNCDLLLKNAVITALEAVAGFLIGVAMAMIIAMAFEYWMLLRKVFYPHVVLLKSVPLIAIAPIITLGLGSGVSSKITMAAIIAFFPSLVALLDGFRTAEEVAILQFKTLGASRLQTLQHLKFPSALPSFFAGMKVSSAFSVVGAIVAEFIGSSAGLGYQIKVSLYNTQPDLAFAAIGASGLLGVCFFGFIALAGNSILRWENESEDLASSSSGFDPASASQDPEIVSFVRRRMEDIMGWDTAGLVSFFDLDLEVPDFVFPPNLGEGSRLLAQALQSRDLVGKRVLDLGTGSGCLAILAAKRGAADVVATDLSKDTIDLASMNAERNHAEIDFRIGDLWVPIRSDEKFDLIIFNLPFMDEQAAAADRLAWIEEAGAERRARLNSIVDFGYSTLRNFLANAGSYLLPGGRILAAFSEIGDLRLFKMLTLEHGYQASIAEQLTSEANFYVFEMHTSHVELHSLKTPLLEHEDTV